MGSMERIGSLCSLLAMVVVCAGVLVGFSGCDDETAAGVMPVRIGGEKFLLEIVSDDQTRAKGLMGRDHIDPRGGMIFVFPPSQNKVHSFWMKNCLVDMDIAYLDDSGRVLSMYTMEAQPLQGEAGDPDETEFEYNARIRRTAQYSSRFPCRIVVEVRAGTLESLGVEEGDRLRFDVDALKAMAR